MPEDMRKASLLLRVIAKAIDFIVIAIAVKLIPQVGYLSGLLYLVISDGLFDGRSLGKKVLRLRVVSVATGKPGSFKDSVIRNATIAAALMLFKIPLFGWLLLIAVLVLEFLLMLGNEDGLRLGDDLANTMVVED
ncbi:MAG: hypothetical protein C0415_03750 [Thermodesulfovibrio sp.]|nr:hypothetical protein [Thermodesulfovibrio sp.]